jgi:probable F420-dependent oxidoreductase
LRLGVNVPNFGPGTTPSSLASWVRFAGDTGFQLAMVSDHVAVTADVAETYPPPFYDPFTLLAWLAGSTERIELGTTVTVLPYRSPLLTARVAANIDQLSGGRFILGVGVGIYELEFAALDIPFHRRGAITDDYLAAIKELWTSEVATHHGEFISFDDVRVAAPAAREPHLPIWVGGASPAAIRRAARFGDAWHPNNAELGWLETTGLVTLSEMAEAAGRTAPALSPRMRVHVSQNRLDEDVRRVGEGTLSQVLGDLEELARLGADYVVLDTNPDHPSQRRPTHEDWQTLEAVASRADWST